MSDLNTSRFDSNESVLNLTPVDLNLEPETDDVVGMCLAGEKLQAALAEMDEMALGDKNPKNNDKLRKQREQERAQQGGNPNQGHRGQGPRQPKKK